MKRLIQSAMMIMAFSSTTVQADEAAIRQAINKAMPSVVTIDSVKPSEINGLYEILVDNNIFYSSEDGRYLIQGHIIDLQQRKDLTEAKLAQVRRQAIEALGEEQSIIFKPEKSQYKVTVFTDIDCGYCRKLHSEIDQYMVEGITIQYLFFPRAGKGSESYNKAVSVWCADDRHAALTEAKQGNDPEAKTCDNPVDKHMALGVEFEARGTPMIVTEKGSIFPGYLPAKKLAAALAKEKAL